MSTEEDNKTTVIKPGPPWQNVGVFQTYEAAKLTKENLMGQKEDHQFKIKRLSAGFVVKSRLHPDLMPKKETKKNGKNRKSRKRNSDKGKVEISETSL